MWKKYIIIILILLKEIVNNIFLVIVFLFFYTYFSGSISEEDRSKLYSFSDNSEYKKCIEKFLMVSNQEESFNNKFYKSDSEGVSQKEHEKIINSFESLKFNRNEEIEFCDHLYTGLIFFKDIVEKKCLYDLIYNKKYQKKDSAYEPYAVAFRYTKKYYCQEAFKIFWVTTSSKNYNEEKATNSLKFCELIYKLIKDYPTDMPTFYNELGNYHCDGKRSNKAIEYYTKSLNERRSYIVYKNLAQSLNEVKKYRQALESIESSLFQFSSNSVLNKENLLELLPFIINMIEEIKQKKRKLDEDEIELKHNLKDLEKKIKDIFSFLDILEVKTEILICSGNFDEAKENYAILIKCSSELVNSLKYFTELEQTDHLNINSLKDLYEKYAY